MVAVFVGGQVIAVAVLGVAFLTVLVLFRPAGKSKVKPAVMLIPVLILAWMRLAETNGCVE